jgi:hypothetical protein
MLYERSSRMTSSRAPVAPAAISVRRMNGRANASTISASAASRIISSIQWRIRRRRTD